MKTAARLLKKYDSLDNLRRHLDEVGDMKFRYAARVQRSLIENEGLLDISLGLTRINCGIPEMQQVEIARGEIDRATLDDMLEEQAFDAARRSRWQAWLDAAAGRQE
jgi:5'-3' exonuclease